MKPGQRYGMPIERFCKTSHRPLGVTGDRCLMHGDADVPCPAGMRPAQCMHPYLMPGSGRWPVCAECGRAAP